ncbi:carbohydrate ABC transporter permease [Stratiformator vulcanicus]|uniref:Lactose transport system permease protein LacF n=1 Tax=Stratiformator vulcanicus TaxID=2527980 RepID=A0A517R4Q7_9PLAN|nr:sugar ABC transporter permease [Stratiformator vulcanicus]QDT38861.1 Lactose transport system permease protein LacF [Stratiformator vulcanicus]
MSPRTQRQLRTGLAFVSPWLIGFGLLVLYPFAATLYWTFCRYDLLSSPEFIGPDHFERMAREIADASGFGEALWNTFYFAIVSVPASVVLGVMLAVILNRPTRGRGIYRTLVFLPSIVPTVAAAIVWMWLLDPTKGLVNRMLQPLGVTPGWFNSPSEFFNLMSLLSGQAGPGAKDGLILMSLWGIGNFVIIYLAALGGIRKDLYEAAMLDGAGPLSRFRHVTLPALSPVIFFNLIMGLIASVQYFTQAYVVSGGSGGPQGTTTVLSLYIFLWSFKYAEAGYASACAWAVFVVVAVATVLLFRGSKSWVHYR